MRIKKVEVKAKLFEIGKTQKPLSFEAQIPAAHLSEWIHGKFNLSGEQLCRIAQVLQVPLDKFGG